MLLGHVTVFPEQGEEGIQGAIRGYLQEMSSLDWRKLEEMNK